MYRICETTRLGKYITSEEFWTNFADEFIRRVTQDIHIRQYTEWQLSKIDAESGDTVIDLGCGFGRLTIPLAKRGCKVYAVDQCKKFLEYLQEYAKREGVHKNIVVIEGKWEKLEPGKDIPKKIDVVVVSHSLEVESIVNALKLIIDIAKKSIHIFEDMTRFLTLEYEEIVRKIYTDKIVDTYPQPATVVYLTLTCLGLYPNVEIYYRISRVKVKHIDEVIERRLSRILPVEKSEVREKIIEVLSNRIVEKDNDGVVIEFRRPIAHIWCKIS